MASVTVESNPRDSSPAEIFIPDEWSYAADSIAYDSVSSPPPISLVCGPKNCGKTTFSCHLLNTLLKRYRKVAYLDTDVGQPEFTPPGFLSLTVVDNLIPDLGVPILKTPERCFFFGDVSSKSDPTQYMKYIHALCNYYYKEYSTLNTSEFKGKTELPLIVNTPGWVKGIGYDLLVDILNVVSPTHVVKLKISKESKNLPAGTFWLGGESEKQIDLIEINSARQDSFNRSVLIQKDASLLRDLRIMAYFRQCFPNSNITTIKELAHSLASFQAFEVSISSLKIRHLHCTVGLTHDMCDFDTIWKLCFQADSCMPAFSKTEEGFKLLLHSVPKAEIFCSLNATIVGLAVSSKEPEGLPLCAGLGIVRGVDTAKGLLYVITPVPESLLEKVDLLLQGFIQIPKCLLQVGGCISPYMSANVFNES